MCSQILDRWKKYSLILLSCVKCCVVWCLSDGTLNGAPCQGLQAPWHAKDRFTLFLWKVYIGSWGLPGKLQNFTNDHHLLIVAVIWAIYCLYGVKHYIINQSIIKMFKICESFTYAWNLSKIYWELGKLDWSNWNIQMIIKLFWCAGQFLFAGLNLKT